MASIKGIEIKNVKTFRGVEYPVNYQGNIYYNGKKLGFWSQDSCGGPDSYDFNTSELDQIVKDYYGPDSIYNLDCLIDEVLTLKNYEKSYKKVVKEGFLTLAVITDDYSETVIKIPSKVNKEDILKDYKKYIDRYVDKSTNHIRDNVKIYTFNSLSDFTM